MLAINFEYLAEFICFILWLHEVYGSEVNSDIRYGSHTSLIPTFKRFFRYFKTTQQSVFRRSPRELVNIPCEVSIFDTEYLQKIKELVASEKNIRAIAYEGIIVDISFSGCRLVIESPEVIPMGTSIDMYIPAINQQLLGIIVRSERQENKNVVGVKFIENNQFDKVQSLLRNDQN